MCEQHHEQGPDEVILQAPDVGRRALVRGAGGLLLGGGLVVAGAGAAQAAPPQNGWPASSSPSAIGITGLTVAGHAFPSGVRGGQVHTILGYVARRFHNEVEALATPGNWGYNYRVISGSTSLSNHASGTAMDVNAPRHPLGASGTFSSTQVSRIRAILSSCNRVVRWGGDYSGRKDEMHFEINVRPGDSRIAPLVARIGGSPAPAPTITWSTVRSGTTGFRVTVVQHLLRARGQSLTVDGVFGSVTVSRVKAFQSSRGLYADGIVGPKTWGALVLTVQHGSAGQAVVAAQKALRARGYSLTADGIFGATTLSRTKAFQTSRGILADGVIGPRTWARLTI